jgi:hypothetical protein
VTYSNQCGFIYRDAVKDVALRSRKSTKHIKPTVSPFDRVTPSQFLRISVSAYTTPPRRIEYPSAGRIYQARPGTYAYDESSRRIDGDYNARARPGTYAFGLHADDRYTGRSTSPQPSPIPKLVELKDTSSRGVFTLTEEEAMIWLSGPEPI